MRIKFSIYRIMNINWQHFHANKSDGVVRCGAVRWREQQWREKGKNLRQNATAVVVIAAAVAVAATFSVYRKNITKLFDNIPSGYEREECINQISISFFSNPRRQTFLFSNIAYLLHHRKQKQTERIQNNTQNDSCVPVYTQYTLTPVERGLCLSVCVRTSIKSKILTFSLSFFLQYVRLQLISHCSFCIRLRRVVRGTFLGIDKCI